MEDGSQSQEERPTGYDHPAANGVLLSYVEMQRGKINSLLNDKAEASKTIAALTNEVNRLRDANKGLEEKATQWDQAKGKLKELYKAQYEADKKKLYAGYNEAVAQFERDKASQNNVIKGLKIHSVQVTRQRDQLQEKAAELERQLAVKHIVARQYTTPKERCEGWKLTSVDELCLSVRTSNCLKNAGIKTIGEADAASDSTLLKVENFGRKSLRELREVISDIGKVCQCPPGTHALADSTHELRVAADKMAGRITALEKDVNKLLVAIATGCVGTVVTKLHSEREGGNNGESQSNTQTDRKW